MHQDRDGTCAVALLASCEVQLAKVKSKAKADANNKDATQVTISQVATGNTDRPKIQCSSTAMQAVKAMVKPLAPKVCGR